MIDARRLAACCCPTSSSASGGTGPPTRSSQRSRSSTSRRGSEESPGLAWALADATFTDDTVARYQVPVGLRPLDQTERFLEGKGRSMLGDVDTDDGPALVYDALVDPELALAFLGPDRAGRARRARAVAQRRAVEHVGRLRRAADHEAVPAVPEGPNPDVEVTEALARVGFTHISAPVATWRRDGIDLAVVRTFLEAGTEGWQLALTSLRDVYGSRLDPAESGGDFAPEACRLGQITAEMHLKLAEAFGVTDGEPKVWADSMVTHLVALRRAPSTPARSLRCTTRCGRSTTRASRSASTATTTSARRCAPTPAGTSSTSRASPPCRSTSAESRRRRCATWPGCCARSTTRPRSRWPSAVAPPTTTSCAPSAGVGSSTWPTRSARATSRPMASTICCPPRRVTGRPCSTRSSWPRRCTRSATSSPTAPTGCASRSMP